MRRLTKNNMGEIDEYHIYVVLSLEYSKSIIIKAMNKADSPGWVLVLLESPFFGATDDIMSTWYPTLQKRVEMSAYDNEVFNVFEFANMNELAAHWNDMLWLPAIVKK